MKRKIDPTYAKKLLDPRWANRRAEILERDGHACTRCGVTAKHPEEPHRWLEVHHLWYRGAPWEAPDEALTTLCDYCHELTHERPDIGPPKYAASQWGDSLNYERRIGDAMLAEREAWPLEEKPEPNWPHDP